MIELSAFTESVGVNTDSIDQMLGEENKITLMNGMKTVKGVLKDAKGIPGASKKIKAEIKALGRKCRVGNPSKKA